jgi:hypothetical protein
LVRVGRSFVQPGPVVEAGWIIRRKRWTVAALLDRFQRLLRSEVGGEYLVCFTIARTKFNLSQLIELRIFLAIIQVNFFFDAVPEELNTWESREALTSHPVQCYIRPVAWDQMENN